MEYDFGTYAVELMNILTASREQKAIESSVTHILVPLGKSRPIAVHPILVRQSIVENPDQKTREGEIRTLPPAV